MADDALTLDLADEAATLQLGEDLAAALKPGDLVTLSGDLGAGKTTLARALIRALAGDADLEVLSPTFTLVQSYDLRLPVAHFDLYRIADADELAELGLDEALESGAALIEWPERTGDMLPADAIAIGLDHSGDGRRVRISAPPLALDRIRRSLAIRDFLRGTGWGDATRRFLTGDASARAYETATQGGETRVLMNAPRMPDGPPIRDGLPYSRIAHLAENVTPFVAIARILRTAELAAPAIHAADLDQGLLLIEHLGSDGVLDGEGRPIPERYIAAAETLAALHGKSWPRTIEVEPGAVHHVPEYDRRALEIELELVTDWYLPSVTGGAVPATLRDGFAAVWTRVLDRLEGTETSLVLRDYHSPNLIWRGAQTGTDRVGLIDFQDAVFGPSAYDVASLGQDARVTIAPALEAAVKAAYVAVRQADGTFDAEAFETAYSIMAAQRNSKILGIFVRLNVRDGKPGYLRHLPRIRAYLARSLAHPALAEVAAFYRDHAIFEDRA